MSPSTFTFSSSGEKCFTSRFTENLSFSSRICKIKRWLQERAGKGFSFKRLSAYSTSRLKLVSPHALPDLLPSVLAFSSGRVCPLLHQCPSLQHLQQDALAQSQGINIFWGVRKRPSQPVFVKANSSYIQFLLQSVWRFPVSATGCC